METANQDSSDTEHLMVGGCVTALQESRHATFSQPLSHCTVHTPAKVSTDVRYFTFKFEYITYNFNYRVSSVKLACLIKNSMFELKIACLIKNIDISKALRSKRQL